MWARIESQLAEARNAVIPLYGPRGKRIPVHGGCGVLINLNENLFVLTASHVHESLDSHAEGQFLAATDGQFIPLNGRSYRTNSIGSEEDIFDAAVLEIEQGAEADLLRPLSLKVVPADIVVGAPTGECVVFGYPHRDAEKTRGRTVTPKSYWWHGSAIAPESYSNLGINPQSHVAMELDLASVITEHGQMQRSLVPKGVSGSGMWSLVESERAQLNGIFVAARDGLFLGTSIRAHLTLIAQHDAAVFDAWWVDDRRFL